jgi:hypothetical protein
MANRSIITSPKGIKTISWLAWGSIAIAIFIVGFFPDFIGQYYAQGLFKGITFAMRWMSNLVPFAIGELVYIILVIYLIVKCLLYFNSIKIINSFNQFWKPLIINFSFWLLQVYVVFQLIWGLNYSQSNPAKQFNLRVSASYSAQEMDQLSLSLITELNNTRRQLIDSLKSNYGLTDSNFSKISLKSIIDRSILEYKSISNKYPFLNYQQPNLKIAVFPKWGDYFGYLAFYEPITGEAIIRSDLPILVQPFTVCHEIAHQLGYASETEANFIAFVLASQSKDPLFKYAMQLQLFSYGQQAHLMLIAKTGDFNKWKQVVARNKTLLSPQVLKDRQDIRAFFLARESKRIPGSEKMYDQFLKWNKQAKGIDSYNEVLIWAIAYRKQQQL